MAQAEDTELRDLVIEALEKNGSLAKIRALLRANIFLAFENECENIKQNVSLDNVLNIPEGILCLSIIHEFLEFCNLKNTLFVYKSETRQGIDYNYEGQKVIYDKLNLSKRDSKEPVLVTLMKTALTPCQRKYIEQNHTVSSTKLPEKSYEHAYKDEQNCTYIVHEDSSSGTSNSHSDNSSDEKNKLHLRLQLDNSDTDTSSDSARDKTSSEYIPNEHILMPTNDEHKKTSVQDPMSHIAHENLIADKNQMNNTSTQYYLGEAKIGNNSSSDSTSYVDLKPFSSIDKKLLNTTGIPIMNNTENKLAKTLQSQLSGSDMAKEVNSPKPDSALSATLSSVSFPVKNDNSKSSKASEKKVAEELQKSDVETAEYSYDFSSPSPKKDDIVKHQQSPKADVEEDLSNRSKKDSPNEGHHQNSASSHSSVSISDVADLISEKSFSGGQPVNEIDMSNHTSKKSNLSNDDKKVSRNDDDSGDFSESPIPSLSNLSLDIHSD